MTNETLKRVVDCLAETTRYPTQLLHADADLENDLGIDSVKRVEIVIALSEEFGIDLAVRSNATLKSSIVKCHRSMAITVPLLAVSPYPNRFRLLTIPSIDLLRSTQIT